jgi:hypothetical protein
MQCGACLFFEVALTHMLVVVEFLSNKILQNSFKDILNSDAITGNNDLIC